MAGENIERSGAASELPASVRALGDRLHGATAEDDIAPLPALFADAEVFVAERPRIFARSWIIADHQSRLAEDGRYCVIDAGPRSLILTRERADRLHALGNICLHAGYPVCEEEDGAGERLHCPYHDWAYALDGRLLYPALSPERYPAARLRLTPYPLAVCRGLILVGLSAAAPPAADMISALPSWLAAAVVTQRARLAAERNWKQLRAILWSSPETILGGPPCAPVLSCGPLSLFAAGPERAVILRLAPKSSGRTDLQLIRLAPNQAGAEAGPEDEPDGLAAAVAAAAPRLDRGFCEWYWSMMAASP
jgi:nitrite reductase/ring-hydroxylating ferredoxin subunit